jgi:hypothetical protein
LVSAKVGYTVSGSPAGRLGATTQNGSHLSIGQTSEVVIRDGKSLFVGESGERLGQVKVSAIGAHLRCLLGDLGYWDWSSSRTSGDIDCLSVSDCHQPGLDIGVCR